MNRMHTRRATSRPTRRLALPIVLVIALGMSCGRSDDDEQVSEARSLEGAATWDTSDAVLMRLRSESASRPVSERVGLANDILWDALGTDATTLRMEVVDTTNRTVRLVTNDDRLRAEAISIVSSGPPRFCLEWNEAVLGTDSVEKRRLPILPDRRSSIAVAAFRDGVGSLLAAREPDADARSPWFEADVCWPSGLRADIDDSHGVLLTDCVSLSEGHVDWGTDYVVMEIETSAEKLRQLRSFFESNMGRRVMAVHRGVIVHDAITRGLPFRDDRFIWTVAADGVRDVQLTGALRIQSSHLSMDVVE